MTSPVSAAANLVWIIAQLHLLLAGFVLGVPIFAWLCEIVGWKSGEKRYDKLAKEFTKLLTSSYATTALFGGILLFLLIGVLSQADGLSHRYLLPVVYGLLRRSSCSRPRHSTCTGMVGMPCGRQQKNFHLLLGFLLNVFAFFIMIMPNSWATFQASPVVIAEGTDLRGPGRRRGIRPGGRSTSID